MPEETSPTLKGSVMVAVPSLRDPNFLHTVLLLTEHSEEAGAVGYILNRPLGKTVADLLGDEELPELADAEVYLGGPVAGDHLTFASLGWDTLRNKIQVSTHLSIAGARRALQEGFQIRAFVGYAGWSEGQLEEELQQATWITNKASETLLKLPAGEDMWSEVLRGMSPLHRLMAEMPPDPRLN